MAKRLAFSPLAFLALALVALLLSCAPPQAWAAELEGFETDDDSVARPSVMADALNFQEPSGGQQQAAEISQDAATDSSQPAEAAASEGAAQAQARRKRPKKQTYVFELGAISFFIAYVVAAAVGHYTNSVRRDCRS